MISIRRISLGGGFRYLIDSVARGDGTTEPSSSLAAYYAESGTPPGVFLGAGLADLDGGKGLEAGSQVSEEHLWNMLVACSDPVSGETVGSLPRRSVSAPVAGFDLCFSPSKSFSVLWALADDETREVIADCHRQAIDYVISYAKKRCSTRVLARTGSSKRTSPGSSRRHSPTSLAGRTIPSCTAMSWFGIEASPCRTASGGPLTQGPSSRRRRRSRSFTKESSRTFDLGSRARLGGAGTASLGKAAL